MPGAGNPLIIGGGIALGTPAVVNNFLKLTSASPPAANTSARLIERTTSIEILGDGTTSTAIGNGADANGTNNIAIGTNVTTAALTEQIAIGHSWALNNTTQLAIGSPASAAATYQSASAWVGIGTQQTYSLFPSNSVYIGHGLTGGGNSSVLVGASANITGNGAVAIGANAQAALNSISIGQLATTGTGGSANSINIGVSATGPAGVSQWVNIGNRAGSAGTIAAGDITLGHQDNSNNVFSLALILGGGPDHKPSTTVPVFTVKGRQGSGANVDAGETRFIPGRATGNAAGAGFAFQSTTPGASSSTLQTLATAFRVDPSGNITLAAAAGSYGGGAGVAFIGNAGTVPVSNPTGGGILYATAGSLVFRGSAGTVTVLAPA